jgi:hypothetical protein
LFRTFPFLTLLAGPRRPRVETIRLTGAVKNVWASGQLPVLHEFWTTRSGQGKASCR